MESETTHVTGDPEQPIGRRKKPGPEPGQAFKSLLEFHNKMEDKFRRRIRRKHPEMSDQDVEAFVAMTMFEEFTAHPEKFAAHLPRAKSQCKKPEVTARPKPPADAINPTSLADLVKWRV